MHMLDMLDFGENVTRGLMIRGKSVFWILIKKSALNASQFLSSHTHTHTHTLVHRDVSPNKRIIKQKKIEGGRGNNEKREM
jgi:hypothetical protein